MATAPSPETTELKVPSPEEIQAVLSEDDAGAPAPGPEETPAEPIQEPPAEPLAKAEVPAAEETPAAEPDAWIDEAALEMAESANLSRDDLERMSGREELDRHIYYGDRHMLAGQQEQEDRPAPAAQEPLRPAPAAETTEAAAPVELPALDELGEEYAAPFKALYERTERIEQENKQLREQFAETRAQFEQQAVVAESVQFNVVMDDLGHKELFGDELAKVVPGSREWKNREKAMGIYVRFDNRQPSKALVTRAINQAFHTELSQEREKQFRESARTQSKKVLRGGTPTRPAEDTVEEGEPMGEAAMRKMEAYHDELTAKNA